MIVIVNYQMGNLRSVEKALELVGGDVKISSRKEDLIKASKIVLPGVGAFADGMKHLKELNLAEPLIREIMIHKKPFLGICLGMQLLAKSSGEYGYHEGLGILDARVVPFAKSRDLRVPHVGWNSIQIKTSHDVFGGIVSGDDFYFVHSFYMQNHCRDDVAATSCYGSEFTAAVVKDNIVATQFHPEKSQEKGLRILKNFVMLREKVSVC